MAHREWFLVGKKSGSWIYISFPQRVLLSLARQMEEGATFINIEELHKKSRGSSGPDFYLEALRALKRSARGTLNVIEKQEKKKKDSDSSSIGSRQIEPRKEGPWRVEPRCPIVQGPKKWTVGLRTVGPPGTHCLGPNCLGCWDAVDYDCDDQFPKNTQGMNFVLPNINCSVESLSA